MFSIQQIANVWVYFFNESLQNILSQEVSLVQLSQNLEQLVNQTGGEVLKAILEQADEAIYAVSKPEHRYQVKAHRSRILTTLWGDVTFTRTYYQDKTDSSYHYLLDEWLGLDKSTHIEPFCRARLFTRSADVSYRKSVALTTPARLSGQSVLQSIRKLGTIPNQAAVMPAAKPGIHKVYVEADEDHVAMQKGHVKEMKLINVYETKVPVCQGRRKLLGRRTFSGWETPSQLWPAVNRYIQQTYGTEQMPEVVIKGDAAAWIKSGTEYVWNSTHVVDGYHASQYLRKIAGRVQVRPCMRH